MDDSGEVVTTATTAARYVGGHAIDVAPVVQHAPGPGEVRMDVACLRSRGDIRPSDLAHIRKRAR